MPRADGQRALLLATALACAAIALFPLYWIFLTSILPTELLLSRNPPLLPPLHAIDLSAYASVLTRKPLLRWISNSLIVTLGTLALSMTAAAMAGYSLSRYRTAAQQAMGFALLASKMMPAALVVIPFFILFSRAGLIETKFGLVLANSATAVPFAPLMSASARGSKNGSIASHRRSVARLRMTAARGTSQAWGGRGESFSKGRRNAIAAMRPTPESDGVVRAS